MNRTKHLHLLRKVKDSLSWSLTFIERRALHDAFRFHVVNGDWATDHGQYLAMVTLVPLLQLPQPQEGRIRMTEPQAVAFYLLFKKYLDTYHVMEGMAYLPLSMCQDIHKHFLANKNISA